MNLDHPYNAATIEEDATVMPRPGLPRFIPYSGTDGVLPKADTAASGRPVLQPGRGLHEPSAPQR
jgi:hypothetical protein